MNDYVLALAGAVAFVSASQTMAGTCKIESTRAAGEWKFVKVYDADTGKIVLQRPISGGIAYDVSVRGYRVRIDSKLPGGIKYVPGPIFDCVDGNRVKT